MLVVRNGYMMKMSQADFEAFKKRHKKERILIELNARETSFPAELANITQSTAEEIEQLLSDLVSKKLVERVVGRYYKLTYEGHRLAEELSREKKAL